MTGYVVDASVAVKWVLAESFSEEAAQLLAGDATLVAPELLFAEATNALWVTCRRGDIDPGDFAQAVDVLRQAPVAIPASMRQLAPSAARLAVDLGHPSHDCFYLAVSMQEQYPVITADRRFHDCVRRHPYLSDRVMHLESLRAAR